MIYRAQPHAILVLASHGHVAARDRQSGKVLWRASLGTSSQSIDTPFTMVTRISLTDNKVYAYGAVESSQGVFAAMTLSHIVIAIDAVSGEVVWRQVLYERRELVGTMLVDRDLLVVSSHSITLALSTATGELRWKAEHRVRGLGMALAVEGHSVQTDAVGHE